MAMRDQVTFQADISEMIMKILEVLMKILAQEYAEQRFCRVGPESGTVCGGFI